MKRSVRSTKRSVRSTSLVGAFAVAGAGLAMAAGTPVAATEVPQALPFAQGWADAGLVTATDNWDGVAGIVGFRGDNLASTGTDPQTVLGPGDPAVVDINANQANPDTFTTGGVTEFAMADPVVALAGSGTADAPSLVITLATTGFVDVTVAYDLRDIDASIDDAIQPVALQYRVGTSGNFTNVPAAFVADASTGPSLATVVTPVSAVLPDATDDQPVVQVRVITTDAAGSDEWIGVDGIAVTGTPGSGGPASPVASCPAALSVVAGDAGSAPVSATDADSAIVGAAITSPPVAGITLTPGDRGAATLDVTPDAAAGTYPVTVTFTSDDGATASCTVTVTVAPVTLISAIQGSGPASELDGDPVIVDAVVTSLFTRQDVLDGFFVQEEDGDADMDPATSEGLFVFCRGSCPTVATRDLVRLRGFVDEFFEMTQVSVTEGGSVDVLSRGNPLPTAIPVTLPAAVSTKDPAAFESVEGMIATFRTGLTVTEHFELARFGQIELTSGDRPYQFTHTDAPSVAGYAEHLADLATRTIILDDDNNDQNDAVSNGPDEPYPYPTGGLSTTNRMRAGDTVTGLTGVLHYSFPGFNPAPPAPQNDAWRIRPMTSKTYAFTAENPRQAAIDDVGGRVKVAAFNVLNYFTTIDTTSSSSSGSCGPLATLDCRGADSAAELARQRAKEVVAIGALDAAVVGLVELQNDDGTAVRDLIAGLNARPGALPYTELSTGVIGGDAIKVTFIYRASKVTPVGAFDILDSSDDPRFIDTRNRPALNQQFQEVLTGERFTASINHFKSKGSACTPDDPDLLDGQGNCSVTRTDAAAALADHLAALVKAGWDRDVIIMGDLNSYRREKPITTLETRGYVNLIEGGVGPDGYSYLFDGQIGYLDHALGTASLEGQVTGVTEWHVNADEVPLFDYNDTILDAPGEASFERESSVGGLDVLHAADERRSSDHDPVVVGLDLASLTIDDAVIVQAPRGGGTLAVSGTTSAGTATCPTLSLTVNGSTIRIGRTRQIGRTTSCLAVTSAGIATFDRRTGTFAGVLGLPATFRLSSDDVVFVLTVDSTTYGVVRDGRRSGAVWSAS